MYFSDNRIRGELAYHANNNIYILILLQLFLLIFTILFLILVQNIGLCPSLLNLMKALNTCSDIKHNALRLYLKLM